MCVCCIITMISITTLIIRLHIQIQADSVVSDTNGFNNFYVQPFDMRRETQFIKAYSNYIMLTSIPQRAAHFVVFKFSIHLCRSKPPKSDLIWSDPKNSTAPFNIRPQINHLFKIIIFSKASLLGMMSSTLQRHFLSGGLIMTDDHHILSAQA